MYVTYVESHREGGEICEGQEDQAYPSYEDEYCQIDVTGVRKDKPKTGEYTTADNHTDQIDIGKLAYVVVVKYTTGNTFGCSHGHLTIPEIHDSRGKAQEIADQIENRKYKGYSPWCGYFEDLESVDVESFIVN